MLGLKVFFEALAADAAEFAVVHLHQRDAAANRLAAYLEQECFRSVRLLCRRDAQTVPVASQSIYRIETEGDSLLVRTADSFLTLSQRLYQVQQLLPPNFVQAARGVLINLDQVHSFAPMPNGLICAQMNNGDAVYISRKYARALRERFQEGTL